MQKKHTILCWIFEPTFQFLSYIIYKLLHTELYASVLVGSSFSSTSAVLATGFLILQCSRMSTAKQIKNVAGHQAKCIVVFGLVDSAVYFFTWKMTVEFFSRIFLSEGTCKFSDRDCYTLVSLLLNSILVWLISKESHFLVNWSFFCVCVSFETHFMQ